MEVTMLSAQGLKNTSSNLLSHRLRPFVTLTTVSPFNHGLTANGDKHSRLYSTRVIEEGGLDPTWGDKFHVPIDAVFFYHPHSCIQLRQYTKRLLVGPTQLGWCQIPASDIMDGLSPLGSVRRLSYRLRRTDGSRGHGVVNVAVRLMMSSMGVVGAQRGVPDDGGGLGRTVMGIPIGMLPPAGVDDRSSDKCHGKLGYFSCEER